MSRHPSITTRSLLLERLKNIADDEGWREFAGIYREFIRRLALKARLTDDEAEDVVQEVLVSVARNIRGFNYDPKVSSFRHWLTNVIRWRIADQHKRRMREATFIRSDELDEKRRTELVHQIPDPRAVAPGDDLELEWGRAILTKALARVKRRIKPKQYQIYYLATMKEKPVAEVCRRLKVNRGQVYLAKLRVGRLVEKELKALRGRA